MKVHHIGYAVLDFDKSLKVFTSLDYKPQSPVVDDLERNIKLLLLRNEGILVELIAILDIKKKSPIDFLFKEKKFFPGNGIPYHICYLVDDIDKP
jgi:hypothetical protein